MKKSTLSGISFVMILILFSVFSTTQAGFYRYNSGIVYTWELPLTFPIAIEQDADPIIDIVPTGISVESIGTTFWFTSETNPDFEILSTYLSDSFAPIYFSAYRGGSVSEFWFDLRDEILIGVSLELINYELRDTTHPSAKAYKYDIIWNLQTVPEPSCLAFWGLGILALVKKHPC